nr:head GIN domain-containing protein [uncultured Mucilaginibacter sp.]
MKNRSFKKVLPYITSEVKNGTLKIYEKKRTTPDAAAKYEKVNIYITSRVINGIQLSGSGNVIFKDGIISSTLHLALSGSGFFNGKVNVATVDCILNGTGHINLSGITDRANVKVVGSGNFMAGDLKALYTNVEVNGPGSVWIYATKSLIAKVTGSGSVHYSGNPKSITKSKSGGGLIVKGLG